MKTRRTDDDTSTAARNLLSVTGSHRRTLEAIFRHPSTHNLEWTDVVGLIGQIGDAHEKANSEFVFEVAGKRHVMRKPHTKDLTSSEVNLEGIALIFDKTKFHLGASEKMRSVFLSVRPETY